MKKRTRFITLLAVMGLCLFFLWPSITWYYRTSAEDQNLARQSLENIRDYAEGKAKTDLNEIKTLKENKDAVLPENLNWLESKAKAAYKKLNEDVPEKFTAANVYDIFHEDFAGDDADKELLGLLAEKYRKPILAAKNNYQNSVKLGLDLAGGLNVIVKADLDKAYEEYKKSAETDGTDSSTLQPEADFKKSAMEKVLESLTGSVDKFGLSEPVIRQQGDDRIYIEMPGADNADSVKTIILGKGSLNFRLVDEKVTSEFLSAYRTGNVTVTDTDNGTALEYSKDYKGEKVPEDCEILGFYTKDEYGLDTKVSGRPYIAVKKEIALDGQHLKSAAITMGQYDGKPEVDFVLDGEGAKKFGDFTSAHVGEPLAIVSNNKVKSYATIKDAITGGRVQLSGFGYEEAQQIQKVLESAWINVPLSIESQQLVGASLGAQAIKQGIMAILVGLAAIMVFMLIFYKGAGFNAVVAQLLNIYLMFSILSAFNLTLSLSSIAGMILTIGMAVDANVIIFERIKEELLLGKSRSVAIATGFENAFWAIMDSNITTFIAAIFLSQLGSGTIQGFAVSLAIGVVSSVFTALFVSRLIFDFNTETVRRQNMSIGWRVK